MKLISKIRSLILLLITQNLIGAPRIIDSQSECLATYNHQVSAACPVSEYESCISYTVVTRRLEKSTLQIIPVLDVYKRPQFLPEGSDSWMFEKSIPYYKKIKNYCKDYNLGEFFLTHEGLGWIKGECRITKFRQPIYSGEQCPAKSHKACRHQDHGIDYFEPCILATQEGFHNWASEQPDNNDDREFCMALSAYDGLWHDLECSDRRFATCVNKNNHEDWKITERSGTFAEAENLCRQLGENYIFASPNSNQENRIAREEASLHYTKTEVRAQKRSYLYWSHRKKNHQGHWDGETRPEADSAQYLLPVLNLILSPHPSLKKKNKYETEFKRLLAFYEDLSNHLVGILPEVLPKIGDSIIHYHRDNLFQIKSQTSGVTELIAEETYQRDIASFLALNIVKGVFGDLECFMEDRLKDMGTLDYRLEKGILDHCVLQNIQHHLYRIYIQNHGQKKEDVIEYFNEYIDELDQDPNSFRSRKLIAFQHILLDVAAASTGIAAALTGQIELIAPAVAILMADQVRIHSEAMAEDNSQHFDGSAPLLSDIQQYLHAKQGNDHYIEPMEFHGDSKLYLHKEESIINKDTCEVIHPAGEFEYVSCQEKRKILCEVNGNLRVTQNDHLLSMPLYACVNEFGHEAKPPRKSKRIRGEPPENNGLGTGYRKKAKRIVPIEPSQLTPFGKSTISNMKLKVKNLVEKRQKDGYSFLMVHSLNVGAGSCHLVQCISAEGADLLPKSVIVDCGSTGSAFEILKAQDALGYFQAFGVFANSTSLMVSHPDRDHFNYLTKILQEQTLVQAFLGGEISHYERGTSLRLLSNLEALSQVQPFPINDTKIWSVNRHPENWTSATDRAEVSFPACEGASLSSLAVNVGGASVTLTNRNSAVLALKKQPQLLAVLPGDAETQTENAAANALNSDHHYEDRFLLASHHGAIGTPDHLSNGENWIRSINPHYVVYSSGTQHSHPSCEVKQRYQDQFLSDLKNATSHVLQCGPHETRTTEIQNSHHHYSTHNSGTIIGILSIPPPAAVGGDRLPYHFDVLTQSNTLNYPPE